MAQNILGPSQFGTVDSVSGQKTVGILGIPAIVAAAEDIHITATSATTILSWTPTTDCYLLVASTFWANNGTSGNTISLYVTYTSPDAGTTATHYARTPSGLYLNGTTSVLNSVTTTLPQFIHPQGGTPVSVVYRDPANTPNDYVHTKFIRV